MLGLSPCNETNWEEKAGERGGGGAGVHAALPGFFFFPPLAAAQHGETEERSLGFSGPRQGKKKVSS